MSSFIIGLVWDIWAICGFKTMKIMRVGSPIAQGLSMGTAAHAVGTSTAMDISSKYGAYASLGLTLNGIAPTILLSNLLYLRASYKRVDLLPRIWIPGSCLKGKKFQAKRNHINRFRNTYPDYEYTPITPDRIQECLNLVDYCKFSVIYESPTAKIGEWKITITAIAFHREWGDCVFVC